MFCIPIVGGLGSIRNLLGCGSTMQREGLGRGCTVFDTFKCYNSAYIHIWITIGSHHHLPKTFLMDMRISLLDCWEHDELQNITLDMVQSIVQAIEDDVHSIFLNQVVVVYDISWALHRLGRLLP